MVRAFAHDGADLAAKSALDLFRAKVGVLTLILNI